MHTGIEEMKCFFKKKMQINCTAELGMSSANCKVHLYFKILQYINEEFKTKHNPHKN